MAFDAHANFGVSSIAVAPSPATTGTSLTVATGEGTRFPAVPFNATLAPSGVLATPANAEIVRVTARSGDVLTITRAQEGSVARAVVVGDLCIASITAKALQDLETAPFARTDQANSFTETQSILSPAALHLWDGRETSNLRLFRLRNAAQNLWLEALADDGTTVAGQAHLSRTGSIASAADFFEKNRPTAVGHWTDIPQSAGNFTADTGTWTMGSVYTYAYSVIGKTMTLVLHMISSSVSGSPTQLRLALPSGYAGAHYSSTVIRCVDNNTRIFDAVVEASPATSYLTISKDSGAFVNSSSATHVLFTTTFAVQ